MSLIEQFAKLREYIAKLEEQTVKREEQTAKLEEQIARFEEIMAKLTPAHEQTVQLCHNFKGKMDSVFESTMKLHTVLVIFDDNQIFRGIDKRLNKLYENQHRTPHQIEENKELIKETKDLELNNRTLFLTALELARAVAHLVNEHSNLSSMVCELLKETMKGSEEIRMLLHTTIKDSGEANANDQEGPAQDSSSSSEESSSEEEPRRAMAVFKRQLLASAKRAREAKEAKERAEETKESMKEATESIKEEETAEK